MVTFSPFRKRPLIPKIILAVIILTGSFLPVFSQAVSRHIVLKWNPARKMEIGTGDSVLLLSFQGSSFREDVYGFLPVFQEVFPVKSPDLNLVSLGIGNPVYQEINKVEITAMRDLDKITADIVPGHSFGVQRSKSFLDISFVPIRRNPATGNFERLISFDLSFETKPNNTRITKSTHTYADHSELSAGSWYKMAIPVSGIYLVHASDLKKADPAFANVDPRTIQIFGNNGGMLPESNAVPRIDDLREISIQVIGSDPSRLNDNDYILFYAKGPDSWTFNKTDQLFHHQKNLYSNYSYCFITYGQATGKRVVSEPSVTTQPGTTVSRFNDFVFYEPAEVNLIKTGRGWYSKDVFELTTTRDYNFNFTDLDNTVPVSIQAVVAAHCTSAPTSFVLYANSQQVSSVNIPQAGSYYTDTFAYERLMTPSYTTNNPASIKLTLNFIKPYSDGTGYLRSLEMNFMHTLRLSNGQLAFRSVSGSGAGNITRFNLSAGTTPVAVWDVTDPGNVASIGTTQSNNLVVFTVPTDTIREFTAFDGTSFLSVQSFVKIGNQDLHSTGNPDLVIVTNPAFMAQANSLGAFHQQHDNMSVVVTTPDAIYNEFSSGAQDISAIRDYVKMIYDRSGKTSPKYLLMFGDASYDYKDRVSNNTNFVPTFESSESLNPVASIVTDDFYGLMDPNEGQGSSGFLDIGVGRLPVQTSDQADAAVNKIIHYSSNSDSVKNDWRNIVCFVADDWDNNLHQQGADTVHIYDSAYNVDKIYLGAYDRISTPGGLRYPEVNEAITRRVEKGALIVNYVGHGGVLGWAHARVLEIPQIKSWQNFDNMPVFVTATCEFSYFDDPAFTSAGEEVFLNPHGGGIALLTTTRPTYSDGNQALLTGFYMNAFRKTNGEYPRLGDLIMDSKNFASYGPYDINARKFVLLGDPALQMAYPRYHVVTTSIGTDQKASGDTINALSKVTISGEVRDDSGNRITTFNGTVFPTVYDKLSEITTIPLEGDSPFHFTLRKNIIYKGKLAVTNGQFAFSFIVPKDIAYSFGGGKISYYAKNETTDANGYDLDFIVGGYNNQAGQDNEGPVIRLFMNDTTFVSGGITDQNPHLLAYLSDSSGINTVGNGIGHDLTAVLDDNTQSLKILNDYYVADLNTFKKGIITYPFFGLSDGYHTVTLKVWDVYNNSSDASLEFLVVSTPQLAVEHLFNYPNPFFDRTTFSFEYNMPNTDLNVQIDIYSLNGQKVKTLRLPLYSNGYRANTIEWDGSADTGGKIGSGTYVYYVKVTTPDGATAYKTSKLVVIR